MKILSIETSADETAVSIVQVDGSFPTATYTILGNALFSQVDSHKEYGGIHPSPNRKLLFILAKSGTEFSVVGK